MNYGGQETMNVDGPDQDGVLVVTLNRPKQLNTTSPQMYDELSALLRKLRNPPDVGASGHVLAGNICEKLRHKRQVG